MDKIYLTYNIEELSADELFIGYAKRGENTKEWEAWLRQHPEMEQTVRVAKQLLSSIQFADSPLPEATRQKMWKHIEQSTHTAPASGRVLRMVIGTLSVAAVLLLGWMIFGPTGLDEFYVPPSEIYSYNLPDQSTIKLNADSRVLLDEGGFLEDRTLSLEGEAFFDVKKGSSFTVDLGSASVEVLGTSFNIYNRNDSIAVMCYTGRVKVSSQSQSVVLSPGQQVTFRPSAPNLINTAFQLEEAQPSWIEGNFRYENAALISVIREVERQYNVRINVDINQIQDFRWNGGFAKSNSLENTLVTICDPFGLSFKIIDQAVEIY